MNQYKLTISMDKLSQALIRIKEDNYNLQAYFAQTFQQSRLEAMRLAYVRAVLVIQNEDHRKIVVGHAAVKCYAVDHFPPAACQFDIVMSHLELEQGHYPQNIIYGHLVEKLRMVRAEMERDLESAFATKELGDDLLRFIRR
jgi:hypothetical protein